MRKLPFLALSLLQLCAFASTAWALDKSVSPLAAIAARRLTGGSSTTDATSYTTAVIAPSSNTLVLATIQSRHAATEPTAPTITGCGLTWVLVRSQYEPTQLPNRKLATFRALGPSPVSDQLTIDFAGQTQTHCTWSICEFAGTDTTGTDGSGAIVKVVGASSVTQSSTSQTVSLEPFQNPNNIAYGAFLHFANEPTAPGIGFSEIDDIFLAENPTGFQTEYKSNGTIVGASWASSTFSSAIAIELKALGPVPRRNYYFAKSEIEGDGSIGNPWQTFKGKLDGDNALRPGDACYFNRGDVWEGSAAESAVNSSGTAADPIVLDAYGEGDEPVFAGAVVTSSGWSSTGANSIYMIGGQFQTHLKTVVQGTTKALGLWRGSVTTLPEGTFQRMGSTLYVRCWGNTDPASSDMRIASFAHAPSVDGRRGLVRTNSPSLGSHIRFRNLKVLGANGIGFSASGNANRFERCVAVGCGEEGFLAYHDSNESADGTRFYDCEWAYNAASGTGFGQGATTYAPRVWFVDCNAHDNFMAGIDFLEAHSEHNVTESGALRCTVTNNGRWQDSNDSLDPNIYIDGASEIYLYGNVVSGGGTLSGAMLPRPGIGFGSEHASDRIAENIYIINNLIYKNHWQGIFGENKGPTKPNNIKNIYVINNTVIAYLGGTFEMCWSSSFFDPAPGNWAIKNNIFIAGGGNNRINLYARVGAYLDIDYNLYYRTNGNEIVYATNGVEMNSTQYNLDDWKVASGGDDNSINVDPLLVFRDENSLDAHLSQVPAGEPVTSRAVDAGLADPYPVPSWLPVDLFPYGTGVRGSTRSDGVFDETGLNIDLGYHYNSGDPDPSLVDVQVLQVASPDPAVAGYNLVYTISVANLSLGTVATNVIITDILSADVMFVSATSSVGTVSGVGPVTCNIASLPAGTTATMTVTVKAKTGPHPAMTFTVTNDVSASAAESDSNMANNNSLHVTIVRTDTDGDGMPDDFEVQHNLKPDDGSDAAIDADGDGFTNLQEFFAGTDPTRAASALRITTVRLNGGDFIVSFPSVAGKSYRLDRSEDLFTWTQLPGIIVGTGEIVEGADSGGATGQMKRFYRIRLIRPE